MPRYESVPFDPPAPVARVVLRAPGAGREVFDVAMLIDSGADVTLVPSGPIRELGIETEEAFDDLGHSLAGTSAAAIADELAARADAWSLMSWAPELVRTPLIVIAASRGLAPANQALGAAIAKAGGTVTNVTMDADHSFSDHRIGLASAIVGWLQALPAVPTVK